MNFTDKVTILAESAKYDASCSSSGSMRKKGGPGLGSAAPAGICHTFSSDGRCISLLKILLTNACRYDCHYCVNRCSNDIPRARLTPQEVADLTMAFYRRNYIEGLFLSSGIPVSPDQTMMDLIQCAKLLRTVHHFQGYIHLKAIPGADPLLIQEAGMYCDRLSVNIELPSEESFPILTPQKRMADVTGPMGTIASAIRHQTKGPLALKGASFAPAGQSTQLIVGATADSDHRILLLAQSLYSRYQLKRVYYSAYMPVNQGPTLPELIAPPLLREHRIYQADWLLRFYGFSAQELLNEGENFEEEWDPKTTWALRHPEFFPVEIQRAPKRDLLRVPGIGVQSALRIIKARAHGSLEAACLKKMGIVMKRACHFITCGGKALAPTGFDPLRIRSALSPGPKIQQLSFFDDELKALAEETFLKQPDALWGWREEDVCRALQQNAAQQALLQEERTRPLGGF